jgi:hypothetical protein
MRRLEPFLENLRAWQCKKIYYFPDATNDEMFRGKGPEYSVRDISKSAKQAYWRLALESFRAHQTQAKGYLDSLSKLSEAELEKKAVADGWGDAQRFVLGKSLVGGSLAGDIFENIKPGGIAFVRPNVSTATAPPEVSVVLAGPWRFYEEFRRAHGLTLWHPEPPEIALQAGTSLVVPLWLRNETATAREITLTADLPPGWKLTGGTGRFVVAAKQVAASRVEIDLPQTEEAAHGKQELREVTVRGESNGQSVGVLKLRVELRKRALPE